MDSDKGIVQQIRQAAARKILFLPHAVQQMSRPERLISAADVRHVVDTGRAELRAYPARALTALATADERAA